MTSLATNLPELFDLLPRVRERLAEVLDARQQFVASARSAESTLGRRAADARALLGQIEDAAGRFADRAAAGREQVAAAAEALQAESERHKDAISALEAEIAARMDALEVGADELRGALSALVPTTAAAWEAVERATEAAGSALREESAGLRTLADGAAETVVLTADECEKKQLALSGEWEQAHIALETALAGGEAGLSGLAEFVAHIAEEHGVELESATTAEVDAGDTLTDEIGGRLEGEVAQPLVAAGGAALAALEDAGRGQATLAAEVEGTVSALAEAAARMRALLPATRAQVEAARIAAAQVDVDWK